MARTGIGGRTDRRRRIWLIGVGTLLLGTSLVYVAVQLTHGGLEPSDTTGLLSLPLGVLALTVSVMPPRQLPEGDLAEQARGWAATLASQVEETEGRQWRRLLGDDTQRINLAFTLRAAAGRAAVAPPAGRLFEGTPTVPEVAEYYRHTRPRRLVVTGAPGAGKTVLALELMLALLEGRGEDDPVPVRLSPAEWDTDVPLTAWLTRHLVDVYDWPQKMAAELVRQHRVLPVLDGLDEMDSTRPDGTPIPGAPRARAACDALNRGDHQHGRAPGPVVLTCRTAHYQALAGRAEILDAARVDIGPVTAPVARDYLLRRTTDPDRWEPVLEASEHHPAGTLATTLSTPWRLCLAATAYAREGDPADLLRQTSPPDLDEHLLARFIPAATALHACGPYGHRHGSAQITAWLARLARHLDAQARRGASGSDLVLHELWPIAGPRPVRRLHAALALPSALVLGVYLDSVVRHLVPGTWSAPWSPYAVIAGSVAFVVWLELRRRPTPRRIDLHRLRTWRRIRQAGASGLRAAIIAGSPAGLLFWFLFEGPLGWAGVFAGGIIAGVMAGLMAGLNTGAPGRTWAPRDPLRADLRTGLTVGLVGGSAVGIMMSVLMMLGGGGIYWSAFAFPLVLAGGLLIAFTFGSGLGLVASALGALVLVPGAGLKAAFLNVFMLGPVAALAFRPVAWTRYALAVGLLAAGRKLPWRPGVLDWACAAGVMRLAGAAYQFRHRELQHWLARRPTSPPR